MAALARPRSRHEFEIAIICALRKESDAVQDVFDGHWRDHGGEFTKLEGDTNIYWTGWIGCHNVVLVQLPGMGNANSAGAAGSLLPSFPRIRLSLVVGICGGVPGRTEQEIILGDVVIGTRIIHVGPASCYPDGLIRKVTWKDQLGQPSGELMAFLEQIQGRAGLRRLQNDTAKYTQELRERDPEYYGYPGVNNDRLYEPGYRHKHHRPLACAICASDGNYEGQVCDAARKASCVKLGCDDSKLVSRERLGNVATTMQESMERSGSREGINVSVIVPKPFIHFGPVGSGDWVVKSQVHRDSLNEDVIAYEMEGSGVSHNLPTLVIKGVCDYADSHKSKLFQNYATATAAACMRAVLHAWPKLDHGFEAENRSLDGESMNWQNYATRMSNRPGLSLTYQPVSPPLEQRREDRTFQDQEARAEQLQAQQQQRREGIQEEQERQAEILAEQLHQEKIQQEQLRQARLQEELARKMELEEKRKWYHDSLLYDQIDSRYETIKSAHAKTCRWVLSMPQYQQWLAGEKPLQNRGHNFFWFKGKPGAGKSTLMKFLLANIREHLPDTTVLSFFFNARGGELEKSPLGMYRSLLFQLLEEVPSLQNLLDALPPLESQDKAKFYKWRVEKVRSLFEEAIKKIGQHSLICFIDALDECEEDQVRDMVTFFERLGHLAAASSFRTCFSSRHYPNISTKNSPTLVLEEQDNHRRDIANYLNSQLKAGNSKLLTEIKVAILERASGVFLWVCLVVAILNKEYDHGRTHAMKKRLDTIPKGLDDLFYDILTRDTQNMDELILCLQLVLFARRPLRPKEIYHAILAGADPESISASGFDTTDPKISRKFILSASKGLTEVTRNGSVQFIHESVRDYFLKGNGLQTLWPDLFVNFQGLSHERLRVCCRDYIKIAISQYSSLGHTDKRLTKEEVCTISEKLPFLGYAILNIIFHADATAEFGFRLAYPVECFSLERWISFCNFVEHHNSNSYNFGPFSPLYIYATENLGELVRAECEIVQTMDIQGGDHGTPLVSAIMNRSNKAAGVLLEPAVQSGTGPTRKQQSHTTDAGCEKVVGLTKILTFASSRSGMREPTLLAWASNNNNINLVVTLLATCRVALEVKDTCGRTPLALAAQKGHETVVKLLLATGQVNVDTKDDCGQTPLCCAAREGHEAVVKLLLTAQADVDHVDNYGQTPLSLASETGYDEVVKLLLATDRINLEAKDKFYGRTPLSWAALNGHEAVVKLLLATGQVDLNPKDDYGQTPLAWASEVGHSAVVELLLATGQVDLETKDKYQSRTPLSWAAEGGHKAVIKLLLKTGKVDVNAKDKNGQTPLSVAVVQGKAAAVRLLLATGLVDIEDGDRHGQTPLSRATTRRQHVVIELLLQYRQTNGYEDHDDDGNDDDDDDDEDNDDHDNDDDASNRTDIENGHLPTFFEVNGGKSDGSDFTDSDGDSDDHYF